MQFKDFQLNIPSNLIEGDFPDQYVNIYYGVEDGRVYLAEFGIGTVLAKLIKNWEKLETLAQTVAEEREASEGIEKAEMLEEYQNLKQAINY